MHPIKHFKTITYHKYLVMKYCFRLGLYWQGLVHDLSKYGPTEFLVGAKYYQGTCSPNNAERLDKGYSEAWLHHQGRNKHHFEYWIDYSTDRQKEPLRSVEMPARYLAEMFCDRVAASRNYLGTKYTDASAYDYYMKSSAPHLIAPKTAKLLEQALYVLKQQGEPAAFAWVKKNILKK